MYPSGLERISKFSLIHHECCQLLEVFCEYCHFLIILHFVFISILLVSFNGGFDGEEIFIRLGTIFLPPFGILKFELSRVVIYGADGR